MFPFDISGTISVPRKPGVSEGETTDKLVDLLSEELRESGAEVAAVGPSIQFRTGPSMWQLDPLLRPISNGLVSLKVQGKDVVARYRITVPGTFVAAVSLIGLIVALTAGPAFRAIQVALGVIASFLLAASALSVIRFRYLLASAMRGPEASWDAHLRR
jgi:hypothetical protein